MALEGEGDEPHPLLAFGAAYADPLDQLCAAARLAGDAQTIVAVVAGEDELARVHVEPQRPAAISEPVEAGVLLAGAHESIVHRPTLRRPPGVPEL